MDDPLMAAARCVGVPTHTNAGPGDGFPGERIWDAWPRHRLEIAHEALEWVMDHDPEAGLARARRKNIWRAYRRSWSYEGEFIDAVATLVLHVAETGTSTGNQDPSRNSKRTRHIRV